MTMTAALEMRRVALIRGSSAVAMYVRIGQSGLIRIRILYLCQFPKASRLKRIWPEF
jgi:hypothetical protein